MFGMGGFQLLPFYEAMRALGLRTILINDERCGAFAADAYARVTNRPGVCDATLGPGATNLVTALVESLNAGMPQIAIVGDANRDHAWKNMTQEARQIEILRPAVKELIRVEATKRIPELLRRAFAVATCGRPGPVVLDVPEDVCHGEHDFDAADFWVDPGTPAGAGAPHPARSGRARARRRASSPRPSARCCWSAAASTSRQAYDALLALAEGFGIPVAHTMSGKGAIACTHPLSAGLFGRYSRIANDLVAASDALIVVGCKLGEIADPALPADPAGQAADPHRHPGRGDRPHHPHRRGACRRRAARAAGPRGGARRQRARRARSAALVRRGARAHGQMARGRRRPAEVGREADQCRPPDGRVEHAMPEDAILVADGGFAGHWGGLLFDTKRAGRHFIADRGFASIGYGLPGCMGAQLAAPKRRVVGLTGDGGFNMTLGELETARRVGAPFVLCVFNNAASGYVKALQHSCSAPATTSPPTWSRWTTRRSPAPWAATASASRIRPARAPPCARAWRTRQPDRARHRGDARSGQMLPGVDNRTLGGQGRPAGLSVGHPPQCCASSSLQTTAKPYYRMTSPFEWDDAKAAENLRDIG